MYIGWPQNSVSSSLWILMCLTCCRVGRVALLRRAAGRHRLQRRQHLVELQVERAARHRVEMQQHRRAHQVAGRDEQVVAVAPGMCSETTEPSERLNVV